MILAGQHLVALGAGFDPERRLDFHGTPPTVRVRGGFDNRSFGSFGQELFDSLVSVVALTHPGKMEFRPELRRRSPECRNHSLPDANSPCWPRFRATISLLGHERTR
jgi:hypothetical protein